MTHWIHSTKRKLFLWLFNDPWLVRDQAMPQSVLSLPMCWNYQNPLTQIRNEQTTLQRSYFQNDHPLSAWPASCWNRMPMPFFKHFEFWWYSTVLKFLGWTFSSLYLRKNSAGFWALRPCAVGLILPKSLISLRYSSILPFSTSARGEGRCSLIARFWSPIIQKCSPLSSQERSFFYYNLDQKSN